MQQPENGRRRDLNKLPLRREKGTKKASGPRVRTELVLDNEKFVRYYREQGIVPEAEFDALLECLRTPLPSVFRITECSRHFSYTKATVERIQRALESTPPAGCEQAVLVEKIPWYPGGCAYKMSASRQQIRRDENLSKLHEFLVSNNRLGSINRQEEVSMVPVQLLDLEPGHKVLDMCASPGSKTAQIIDLLMRDETAKAGLIVANDVDLKRCWMLSHQLKRFGCSELVITNHSGQSFPKAIEFDRVLCDVPCTGDGTLRKQPVLWSKWSPENAFSLHRHQIDIAWRSMELLAVGGKMVYSTCALNPLENEAVVAEILRRGSGRVQLVDVSSSLPELRRRNGLTNWKVKRLTPAGTRGMPSARWIQDLSPEGGWFESYDAVPPRRRKLTRSMFPPESDDAKRVLRRCLRLVPQDQNSGAFFIAVLTKRAPVDDFNELAQTAVTDHESDSKAADDHGSTVESVTEEMGKLWGTGKIIAKDPLRTLSDADRSAVIESISTTYDMSPEFVSTRLLFRDSEAERFRRLYYTSPLVQELLERFVGRFGSALNLRVVHAGVRVFECDPRAGVGCDFRFTSDGVHVILDEISRQKVFLSPEDYWVLVSSEKLPLDCFQSDEANRTMSSIDAGTVAFILKGGTSRDVIIALKGGKCLTPFIQTETRQLLQQELAARQT